MFVRDTLTVAAEVTNMKHKIVNVDANVFNQDGIKVADLQATGYRKSEQWQGLCKPLQD